MSIITLIRPPVVVAKWAHTTPTCPPIGLAYIAGSLVHDGHSVQVIDAVGKAVDQFLPLDDRRFLSHGLSAEQIADCIRPDAEILGISCMFSHEWPLIRDIIRHLRGRHPDAIIIGGGEHISAMPEFSLEACAELDYCAVGEGEETICALVKVIAEGGDPASVNGIVFRSNGTISRTLPRIRIRAIDDIPPPAWELFPLDVYLDNGYGFGVTRGRSMPVLATRGCPYQCTFCSNPSMWGTRWISRDVDRFFSEMRQYEKKYKIDNFDFYDLTAIVKKDWIVRFCTLLKNEKCTFTWQLPSGTRSEAIDKEVTRLLYESGCRNMSYAPESGSISVLTRIKKKIRLDKMKESMRAAIKNGINCKANIIIGFPGETHREVWQTLKFIAEMALLGLHDMSVSPFSPYPGSELFEEMKKDGKIKEFNDDYFLSLATYTDLTHTLSCSEHISNRWLGFYRIFGMMSFYALLYTSRPWRFIRTVKNVFGEEQESRLEMSLRDLVNRMSRRSQGSA